MSFHLFAIVVKADGDVDLLAKNLESGLKFHAVKKIYTPFKGLVCLSSRNQQEYPFDKFPENFFANQEQAEFYFGGYTQQYLTQLSKQFPEKEFCFIEVECQGGKCEYAGYKLKDGEKLIEREKDIYNSMRLLKDLVPEYNSYYFYPFTRNFLNDIGGLNGHVHGSDISEIWGNIDKHFGSDPSYVVNAGRKELQFYKEHEFELYLMVLTPDWIKVMGRVLSADGSNFREIRSVLEKVFEGSYHAVSIDHFTTGENMQFGNMSDEHLEQLNGTSYRQFVFNEIPFGYSDGNTNS